MITLPNILKKHLTFFSILVFISLSFFLYINNINGDFVFDDYPRIVESPDIRELSNIPQFFVSPFHYQNPETGIFRPLTVISFAINYSMWGFSSWGYHLTNIIMHGLVGAILFQFIINIFREKKENKDIVTISAFLASLLFLFHPITTEAVNSIFNRSESLSALFGLLALNFFITSEGWKKVVIFCSFLFIALLSKESAVTFFIVAMLIFLRSLYKKRKIDKVTLISLLSGGGSILLYALLRFIAVGEYFLKTNATLVENPLKYVDPLTRIATSFKIYLLYLKQLFWPFALTSDYSFNQIPSESFSSPIVYVGVMFFVALVILWGWSFVKRYTVFIGLSILLIAYIIISNLISVIGTIMGERLMYLPLIGIAVAVVPLIQWGVKKEKYTLISILGLILCIFLFTTWSRNEDWKTQDALFMKAAQRSPGSVLARSNSGAMFLLRGDYENAKKELISANAIYDRYNHAVNNLGLVYQHEGDFEKADYYYKKTIEIDSDYINAHINLLRSLFLQEKYDEVLIQAEQVSNITTVKFYKALALINIDPIKGEEYINQEKPLKEYGGEYTKGVLEYTKGNYSAAETYLHNALNAQPVDEYLLNTLAWNYYLEGNNREALRTILVLKQNDTWLSQKYYLKFCEKTQICEQLN